MENFEEFFMHLIAGKSILNIDDVKDILRSKNSAIEDILNIENDVVKLIEMLRDHIGGRENVVPLINKLLVKSDILPYGHLKQIYTRFVNMSTSDLGKYYINFSKNSEINKIISNDLEKNDFNKVKYRKADIIDEIFKEIFKLKKRDAMDMIIKVFYLIDGHAKRIPKPNYNYLCSIDMIINSLYERTIERKNYTSINIKTFLEDKVKVLSERTGRIDAEIKYKFSGLDEIRINKYDTLTSLELVFDDAKKIVKDYCVHQLEYYITVYVKRMKLNNIKIIFRVAEGYDHFILDAGFLSRKYIDLTYKINLLN